MDTPENYYAILGIPVDANSDTLKHAYRQLARRYHPDLAGPEGAVQMKRINRAYDVLSDPEKRRNYDTIIGGVIDLRKGGFARPRSRPRVFDPSEDIEFSGLNIFSTKGPLQAGAVIHSSLGVVSTLSSVQTVAGKFIAAGSLNGQGKIWQVVNNNVGAAIDFAADPKFTIESLRELRFSTAGAILVGWGRLGLHVWDAYSGTRLWSHSLEQRAVSAHYSIDINALVTPDGQRQVRMALPLLVDDARGPRAWGVRGTDVITHIIGAPESSFTDPITCTEEGTESRQFWAIRLRALSNDARALLTFSCANVPDEKEQMVVVRRWDLTSHTRLGKLRPQISLSLLVGRCVDSTPPYAVTPDAKILAFVHSGRKIRLCDTVNGSFSELLSGTMGGSSKLAISPDAQWVAVAREDSEINEGVVDLWAVNTNQVIQKLYHPWQISALYFAHKQLIVALTDGTIQIWE